MLEQMTRLIARTLAGVAAVPLTAMVALACVTPITLSGLLYLLGCGLVVAGTLTASWRRHSYRWIGRTGCLLLAMVAAARLWSTAQSSTVTILTLPAHGRARWINRLIDEQDVALVGARVLAIARLTTPRERHDLVPVLARAYRLMRAAEGPVPSPFVSTYLNREHPNAFDAVVIEPLAGRSTQAGVIFLHGFTGNFTLPCWLVARAVRTSGAVTECPSVG